MEKKHQDLLIEDLMRYAAIETQLDLFLSLITYPEHSLGFVLIVEGEGLVGLFSLKTHPCECWTG